MTDPYSEMMEYHNRLTQLLRQAEADTQVYYDLVQQVRDVSATLRRVDAAVGFRSRPIGNYHPNTPLDELREL